MPKISNDIYAQVAVKDIDMLTKIIEAYEHLGIVSTVSQREGTVIIRGTTDTVPELIQILDTLPFPVEITDN
ncbi:hypothetical protein ASZ90_020029 [hydrocarbon metagenome]|uniref:DUF4911 domain-containing protein n=1 Tax=hydrocarbon metagenome TaxID=938273 RepID=A0A0W8E229_9ZZZZ